MSLYSVNVRIPASVCGRAVGGVISAMSIVPASSAFTAADPMPRIVLVPGLGLFGLGRSLSDGRRSYNRRKLYARM